MSKRLLSLTYLLHSIKSKESSSPEFISKQARLDELRELLKDIGDPSDILSSGQSFRDSLDSLRDMVKGDEFELSEKDSSSFKKLFDLIKSDQPMLSESASAPLTEAIYREPISGARMPNQMQMSRAAMEGLRGAEGFRAHVYDDHTGREIASYDDIGTGNPTIGYGHLIRTRERDRFSKNLLGRTPMTATEAEDLYTEDVRKHEVPWKNQIKVPLTQNMFDAIASFAFNTGRGGPKKYGVIEPLNRVDSNGNPAPDYQAAAEAIRNGPQTSNGRKLRGLVKRRNREADEFLTGISAVA